MSIGIYAIARRNIEYKEWVFYTYAGEDWNANPAQKGDVNLQDGLIIIRKSCFDKQEHLENDSYPDVGTHLENGSIVIRCPCKNEHSDFYALRLLRKILISKRENNRFPKVMSFLI